MNKEFRSFEDLFVNVLRLDLESYRNKQYFCPFCHDTRKNQNKREFYADLGTGNYNCNHCGEKGHINEYCKDKDVSIFKEDNATQYVPVKKNRPPQKEIKKMNIGEIVTPEKPFCTKPIQQSGLDFFKARGISAATVQACKVSQSGDLVAFNYFVGNKVSNAKYRGIGKKSFMQHPKCNNFMYGINDIDNQCVVIVEGEFDKLAAYESGVKSCLSVSQGAPNVKDKNYDSKLKCITNSIKYLESVKEFVIAVDADENGEVLKRYLLARFGKDKCRVAVMPSGCKDLNDVLLNHGAAKVREVIETAEYAKIEGAEYARDSYEAMLYDLENGIEEAPKCNIPEFDDTFAFVKGWTHLFHGIPNSGKSVFTLFLMMIMSVEYGYKWAIFTPEHSPSKRFFQKAVKMLTGLNAVRKNDYQAVTKNQLKMAVDFLHEHFIVVDPSGVENGENTLKNVLKVVKDLKLRHGIDGYCIDPFNQLSKDDRDERLTMHAYIEKSLSLVRHTNKHHDLIGIIVAHPRTMREKNEEGDYNAPTPYELDGGAMWYNKADLITNVHRPTNQSNTSNPEVLATVQKVKEYDIVGCTELKAVEFTFDVVTGWYESDGQNPLYGAFKLIEKEHAFGIVEEQTTAFDWSTLNS